MLEGNLNGFNSLHEILMPISVNVIKDAKFTPAGVITDLGAFAPPEK
jgi:branched-chain amino acid transport system substrate-binding protein